MAEKLGIDLTRDEQREVLRKYVHRFTGSHTPQWAVGTSYPVQFACDTDWLRNTFFKVTKAGKLDNRANYCRSNPTWPAGAF